MAISTRSLIIIGSMMVSLMMVSLPGADAHNWLGNPSRATLSSVTKPCQRRIGDQPHVQVVANQQFQMEWSVGHGEPTSAKYFYFVTLHADDYNKLYEATTADFDTYVREAPNSAYKYNGTMWKKRHLTTTTDTEWVYGYFDRKPLFKNDSRYIPRDDTMNLRGKNRYTNNNFNQYFFYPNQTTRDIRVEYQSAKYPWYVTASDVDIHALVRLSLCLVYGHDMTM
jgi:hypothetical protein